MMKGHAGCRWKINERKRRGGRKGWVGERKEEGRGMKEMEGGESCRTSEGEDEERNGRD